jgi:sigma-B regulation protein RsbU (phosphoserine phosphatase)
VPKASAVAARPVAPTERTIDELRRAEEEIRSLSAEILERYEEATLVYRLSERLSTVLGEQTISELVLQDAARVLRATAGEVWLRGSEGLSLAARVPSEGAAPAELDRSASESAYDGGRPWTREAGPDGGEAAAAVPLPCPDDRPLGVLLLRGREAGRSYRSGEIKLMTALATLTSAFVRNDRLAGEACRAAEREREAEIARQIHRSLLPRCSPEFEGLDLAGVCLAADQIGGDYFGYVALPDGGLGVAAADVSGHGVGAALYMAAAKGALQAEARRLVSPSDLLRRTNEALAADFARSDIFATAFFARFHPGGRRFECANGGHNPPLLIRSDGRVVRLERGGPALGVLPEVVYDEEAQSFSAGDLLLIYTDGMIEARDDQRRFYGIDRLVRCARRLRERGAAEICEGLQRELLRHCGGRPPQDDVTLVVIRGVESSSGREPS